MPDRPSRKRARRAAAARAVGMSYGPARKLLDQLNGMFRGPLLTGHAGGTQKATPIWPRSGTTS